MVLVQFGDLHLDAPFARMKPGDAAAKRAASRKIPANVVSVAEQRHADAILCTGDLFDTPAPYYDSVCALRDAFAATRIPVLIVPGNHDPWLSYSPWTAVNWSGNVTVFTEPIPQLLRLPGLLVAGAGTTQRRSANRLFRGFSFPDTDLPKVILYHGDFDGEGPYNYAFGEDLCASGADLVAMGHVHNGWQKKQGNTLLVMNGSVEARGFGEEGEKGAVVIEYADNRWRTEIVPVGGLRCRSVSLNDCRMTGAELTERLDCVCGEERENILLTLTLTGEGTALPENLDQFPAVQCNDRRNADTIYTDSRPLPAAFRAVIERASNNNPSDRERILLENALRFGYAAICGAERPTISQDNSAVMQEEHT